MRMMVCLVELFSQCTFMYKTTTSRNLIFGFETCPNTVDNKMEQIVQFKESEFCTKPPATCLLLAEAETKFFEKRTERSNILFHF